MSTEREITVPGVLSGDRGKWETIIAASPTFRASCMFREDSLEKIKAKVEEKKNLNRCYLKTRRSVLSGLKHRGEAESF